MFCVHREGIADTLIILDLLGYLGYLGHLGPHGSGCRYQVYAPRNAAHVFWPSRPNHVLFSCRHLARVIGPNADDDGA